MDWTKLFGDVVCSASNVNVADISFRVGSAFAIITYSMKTMVPLRIAGMASNFLLIGIALKFGDHLSTGLYTVLLGLNAYRLRQMLQLIKNVKNATRGDPSMSWLKPFMKKRRFKKGDILFHKDDVATEMFYTVTGRYRLIESGIEIPHGRVVGELGMLAPDNHRTQSLECIEGGELLTITYKQVEELYFQNPEFGFYFLRLSTERLFYQIHFLEKELANCKAAAAH
jgi:hypothetical protein